MPTFVVKPKRDEDFYVLWSTLVDAPVGYGSRSEILLEDGVTPDRIGRADARGTSMRDGDWFDWNDGEFLLHNVDFKGQRNDRVYFVPRASLREFCRRLDESLDVGDLLRSEAME